MSLFLNIVGDNMREKRAIIFNIIMYFMIFLLVLPLIIIVIWSFSKSWPWPKMLPSELGFRGWKYFFDPTSKAIKTLLYSVWLSFVVTIITLVISIPASKALGIYNFRGKKIIELLILAPLIVPPVAIAMGIHLSFIKLGLANTFMGVVLVHLIPCIPYSVRVLKNVFEITGESMEMQARVLGAGPFQAFKNITLPIIAPGIVSAGSLVFIISFSQYFLTFLIGGGRVVTFSMMMFPFIQSGDRMMASVYSIVFILTALGCLQAMERSVKAYYKSGNYFFMN